MNQLPLLTILLLLPLLFAALCAISENMARKIANIGGVAMLLLSAYIAYKFDWSSNSSMQFVQQVPWIHQPFPLEYSVGVDGFSLSLVLLTTVVTVLALMASHWIKTRQRLYYSFVMLLTFSILAVFTAQDLLQFFIAFEFELVPMYFLIAIWGGPNRDYASMKFLLYTFTGGILMLGGLLYLYYSLLSGGVVSGSAVSLEMTNLAQVVPMLPKQVQTIAFLGFFLAFIIKLPSFPFHTWLPDAHVEAPTPISMILAGLLLKMGSYGLVRICMGFFPNVFIDYGNLIVALGAFNIVWAAVACLVQEDMKRIIAYSSVSHMGFVLLGIGSLSSAGLSGAIFQMISHGIISAALFFLVGTIYERCHTRQLGEIGGGLAREIPMLFYFWMLAALANLGLPGLSGFVAESSVYYGAFTGWMAQSSVHAGSTQAWILFSTVGVVLTAGYMLWLLKRLFYGAEQPKWKGHLVDAFGWEQGCAYAMSAMIIGMGFFPSFVTDRYTYVVNKIMTNIASKQTISSRPDPHGPLG
ncbi:MAG TPA: NADH-quinone oxidoreductase subunit M [Planktothrix sp.]|jgi:proton-translocating NADH-quinone oxidoreductase chain M